MDPNPPYPLYRIPSSHRLRPPHRLHNQESTVPPGVVILVWLLLSLLCMILYLICCVTPPTSFEPEATPLLASAQERLMSQQAMPQQFSTATVECMTIQQRRDFVTHRLSGMSRVLPFRQQQNCPGTTYMSIDDQSNSASTKDSDDAIELCVICLDPFLDGEDICVSQNDSCYHQFHMKCALEWLVKSQLCPCCRRDYFAKASGEPESEAFAATQVHGGPLRTDGS